MWTDMYNQKQSQYEIRHYFKPIIQLPFTIMFNTQEASC